MEINYYLSFNNIREYDVTSIFINNANIILTMNCCVISHISMFYGQFSYLQICMAHSPICLDSNCL
jgi:hypothetical protein